MSRISKYLQLTDKLLLEYSYNTYNQADNLKQSEFSVIKTFDNKLMLLENPVEANVSHEWKKSFMFESFPDKNTGEYFYPGFITPALLKNTYVSFPENNLLSKNHIKEIIKPSEITQMAFDTVRIHILTGYIFSDTEGFMLSISGNRKNDEKIENVILKNFTFLKESNIISGEYPMISYNPMPIYMSGKFYDRYIEFEIPSVYFLKSQYTSNDNTSISNILGIMNSSDVNITYIPISTLNSPLTPEKYFPGYSMQYQGSYNAMSSVSANIEYNSNSDYFNAILSIDQNKEYVEYYTTWGTISDDQPMSLSIMNQIETGQIQMETSSFINDTDSDFDSFYDTYGENARKWIIVNQLNITYMYSAYSFYDVSLDEHHNIHTLERKEKFTLTEDFSDDDISSSETNSDYKFHYRPVIPAIDGYECTSMNIEYTARLMNRLNGSEIVRIATASIMSPEQIFGDQSARINVDNISKWVIFNKISNNNIDVSSFHTSSNIATTKYITKFYTNNNIAVTIDGSTLSGTNNTIRLYETSHDYLFTLYTDNTFSNLYSLTDTTAEYLFTYLDKNNKRKSLNPTYSSNMNLESGTIEYNISENISKDILAGNCHFSVIAKTINGSTTIFSGTCVNFFS